MDTDRITERFFSRCHEAGPKVCILARKDDKSSPSIRNSFYLLLSKLDQEPIFATSVIGAIITISKQDNHELLGTAFYKPRTSSFTTFVKVLNDAMAGDTASIVSILFQRHIPYLKDI